MIAIRQAIAYPSLTPFSGVHPIPDDHVKWLDAYDDSDFGLVLYNGNRVGGWKDKFGRGGGWGQGVNDDRPFFDSGNTSPNGKYVVHYPGGDYLNHNVSDAEEFISATYGQTIIIVGGNWTADDDHLFSMWDSGAGHRTFRTRTNDYTVQSNGGSLNADQVATYTRPSGWNVMRYSWSPGTKCRVYKNGDPNPIAESNNNVPSVDLDIETVKLCANSDGSNSLNDGDIANITIWKRDITDAEWWNIYCNKYAEWFL